jgi:hypothetical protein
MRKEVLHLVNRCYIHHPDNKIPCGFAEPEDIIDPSKLYSMLLGPLLFQKFPHHPHYFMFTFLPYIQHKRELVRIGQYCLTLNPELFTSILQVVTIQDMVKWLNTYWNISFIMSTPLYKSYEHSEDIIFDYEQMKCIMEDITLSKLIEKGNYTIGNGFILALSLNALKIWKTKDFVQALYLFLETHQMLVPFFIPKEWQPYYKANYRYINEHPFMYAFQFCEKEIYELVRMIDPYDFGYTYIKSQQKIYISNIYSALLHSKKHHYEFLKKTKYMKLLKNVAPYIYNKYLQFNIHQIIIDIITHKQCLNNFLREGNLFAYFKYIIYSNSRIHLLKFYQSISYLYAHKKAPVRILKLIWRKILKTFPKEANYYIWIYLLECIIFYKNGYKNICLVNPPTKLIRDISYITQEFTEYYKKQLFSLHFYNKFKIIMDISYAFSINNYSLKYTSYSVKISIHEILKLMKELDKNYENLYLKNQKRHLLPLQCIYNNNYELYQIMQKYYTNHPDETWKKY